MARSIACRKSLPGWIVSMSEYLVAAEMRPQCRRQAPSITRRIGSPIAHKDGRHRLLLQQILIKSWHRVSSSNGGRLTHHAYFHRANPVNLQKLLWTTGKGHARSDRCPPFLNELTLSQGPRETGAGYRRTTVCHLDRRPYPFSSQRNFINLVLYIGLIPDG